MDTDNHSSGDQLPQESATVDEALQIALRLHQAGSLEHAADIYQKILNTLPDHVDVLHFFGILKHQQGHSEAAIALIEKAVTIAPTYSAAHNNLGNVYKELGQQAEAEAAYRKVIALQDDFADAHNNLGVVLKDQGQLSQAQAQYERAIAIDENHVDAHKNLGIVLWLQNKSEQAIAAFQRNLQLRPDQCETYIGLGNALTRLGKLEEALQAYQDALNIAPEHDHIYRLLGQSYYRLGRIEQAATIYRQWLQQKPANPEAEHLLAACSGQDIPTRASNEYVKHTFDAFADNFDQALAELEYHGPERVLELLRQVIPQANGDLAILDAGCGTGLCGSLLRPYASYLCGIDLSPKMLAKADKLKVYDQLEAVEITEFFKQNSSHYDVIVILETLLYFGDLSDVLMLAANALKAGGYLLFSVENVQDKAVQQGAQLKPTGRYGHARPYVEQTLNMAGLDIRQVLEDTLRLEVGKPVAGSFFVAHKKPLN